MMNKLIIVFACNAFANVLVAQDSTELLKRFNVDFAIVDSAVFLLEKYQRLHLDLSIEDKLPNGKSFTAMIPRLRTNTCTGSSTIRTFIKCYLLQQQSSLKYDQIRFNYEIKQLYHHALMLFHSSQEEFDENLLVIYHLHRNHVRNLLNLEEFQTHFKFRLSNIQLSLDCVDNSSRAHFAIIENTFVKVQENISEITKELNELKKNERLHLLFKSRKWHYKALKLSQNDILDSLSDKGIKQARKELKQKIRDMTKTP